MIMTGIIMGEMTNKLMVLLNGKTPLTKAKEAKVPKIRESKVVTAASLRLKSVGSTHRSSVKNSRYHFIVNPSGGKTRNTVSVKDIGMAIKDGMSKKIKVTDAKTASPTFP